MKIMIVTPYFYPKVGGLENYALNMALGLKRNGNEVFIVTSNDEKKEMVEEEVKGLRVIRLPITVKLSNTPVNPAWYFQLKRIIKAENPDVINAHMPVPFIADIAIRADGKTPTVITYHSDLIKSRGVGKYLAKLFYVLFMNKTLRKADAIIATSKYYEDTSPYLAKHKRKIGIAHPGIDTEVFNDKVDTTWLKRKYPGKKIVLFVAVMNKTHAHKGLDVLIKSMADVKKKIPEACLVAVGKGDAIPRYKALAKQLGLENDVTFPGFVSDEELPKYYAGADVLALPSTSSAEGFGMVIMEAAACGTPSVGSNIGGIPFAIQAGETGELADPSSRSSLTEKLTSMLESPEKLKKYSLAGVKRAKQDYGWTSQVQATEDILQKVCAPDRSAINTPRVLPQKPMKIMMVTPYFYPKIGGLESYAILAAKNLQAQGHEVIVVTTNHQSKQRSEETIEGLRVIRLSIHFTLSNTPINFAWYHQLRAIVKKEMPDVINAHSPVPFMADMAFAARGSTPFVITYHAGSLKKSNALVDGPLGFYEKTLLTRMLRKSTEVISVYPAFIERLIGKKRTIHFIPPAVDTNEFKPPKTLSRDDATVLYVGRIEHSSNWKGIDVLIRAIKQASLTQPDIKLRLVGEGDAVGEHSQLAAELGISKNVIFSDPLRGKELIKAYQQASMLVLPSTTDAESFGMVLIEAMACQTPVIGSNIGGIPNVISDRKNGLLVEPNNPRQLSGKILEVLGDAKLREKIVANGLDVATNKFSLQQNITRTGEVLRLASEPHIIHATSNYPPHLGGMEQVVKSLADYQALQGSTVRVITSNQGAQSDYVDTIPVKRLASLDIAHTPIMPTLLFDLLKIKKTEVVHLHIAQAFMPEIVWLASKLRGFNYIAHIHLDVPPSGPAGFLLKIYKPLILKRVLRSARSVVVFTDEQKRGFVKKYRLDPDRVKIIANGADEAFFTNKLRTLGDKPTVLFVGRLSLQKNIPQLLHALDGLSDKVTTKLVGDGELSDDLKKLASDLKLQNVSFEGRAAGNKLLGYYNSSDIFVLPSEREGMPLVLLEAMAGGMPIIATNVTGSKDVVQDGKNGLLVPLHDNQALRQAILQLISNPEMYKKLNSGANKRSSNYSWPHIATKFSGLYEEASRS